MYGSSPPIHSAPTLPPTVIFKVLLYFKFLSFYSTALTIFSRFIFSSFLKKLPSVQVLFGRMRQTVVKSPLRIQGRVARYPKIRRAKPNIDISR